VQAWEYYKLSGFANSSSINAIDIYDECGQFENWSLSLSLSTPFAQLIVIS
jgi:hypothetical protein